METNTFKTLLQSGSTGGFVTGALMHGLESWGTLSVALPLSSATIEQVSRFVLDTGIAGIGGALVGSVVLLLIYGFAVATHLHRYVFREYWTIAMVLAAVIIAVLVSGMPSDLLAQMRIAGSVIVGVTTSIWLLRPLLFTAPHVTPLRRGGYYAHR